MPQSFRPYWELLVVYLRPQRDKALGLAALLLGSIGLQLLSPQVVRSFIDLVQQGGVGDALTYTALQYIAVLLVSQIVAAAVLYLGTDVGWRATNLLRADLLAHVLHLDQSFHNRHTPGELIQRVDGDIAALSNFFSQFVVRILGNLLLICGIVLLLLWEEWRLGLGVLVVALLGLLLLSRLQGVAVPYLKAHRQSFAELTGFWEERLLGTEDLRSLGALPYVIHRQWGLLGAHMRKARLGNTAVRVMQSAGELLLATGTAATFALSAYLLFRDRITLGTVYLVFAYTDILAWNVLAIATQLEDLQQATAGIERIRELRAITTVIVDKGTTPLPDAPLEVAFEDISFGYSSTGAVLKHVSFTLAPGNVLGLLGRTGSGKTTLTRLLFRFYDPTGGTIRLGGIDIRQLPLDVLRRTVGIVTQEVQLFHASVRDNLTLFDDSIADQRIIDVLHELGLTAWYLGLPAGLDTELAPGGLSAGEAQLLAFTRVFLQNPAVVILDEASSRLDPATEQRVGQAITRLVHGRTAIIIAHRLATIERVDDVLMLQDGQVVEHGRRASLLSNAGSRFTQLLRSGSEEVLT